MSLTEYGQAVLPVMRIAVYAGAAITATKTSLKVVQGGVGVSFKVAETITGITGPNVCSNWFKKYGNWCIASSWENDYISDIWKIAMLILLGVGIENLEPEILHSGTGSMTKALYDAGTRFFSQFSSTKEIVQENPNFSAKIEALVSESSTAVICLWNKSKDFLINDFRLLKHVERIPKQF
jgi:hypothetical protein